MSSEKKAVDLGLLEEDDEFEEFPTDGKTVSRFSILTFVYLIFYHRFLKKT